MEPRDYQHLIERKKIDTKTGLRFCSSVQNVDFRAKHFLHECQTKEYKFARPLATGVFKSLCTFFHFPDSFFLGSSFFLPLSFFLLTRARTWGRSLGALARESPLRAAGARGVLGFVTCSAPFSCTAPSLFALHLALHLTFLHPTLAEHLQLSAIVCCFYVCSFSFCTVPSKKGTF